VPVSTFNNVPDGANWGSGNSGGINVTYDDVEIQMGDDGTLAGPDIRIQAAFVFDLSTSGGLPKGASISDVKVIVGAAGNLTLSGGDADHRMALMSSDGQWDRATSHALHKSNSGIVYGAPSVIATTEFRGVDSDAVEVFDTVTAAIVYDTYTTSATRPSYGCTFKLPANKNISDIYPFLARADVGTSSEVTLAVYSLAGNARHYAIDELLGRTFRVPYNVLPAVGAERIFHFVDPIAATDADRWLAVVLEGEIFDDGTIKTNHRITYRDWYGSSPAAYRGLTEGSMFLVSKDEANDNSLNGIARIKNPDVPHFMLSGVTTFYTTPFERHVGNVLASSDSSVTYVDGTPYNYGSPASGQLNEVSGIVAEVQTWVDSAAFDPSTGKHFLGLMVSPFDPDDELWEIAGTGHGSIIPCKLEITYTNLSNVRSDSETRSRIFVATEVRDRVRPRKEETRARVRAPQSSARSNQ
jgi:hypothetical protein